jgi:ElaB/YqjD/DUF883 family membrane-anchored ribosome-binding protein
MSMKTVNQYLETLAANARSLLEATSDVAEEKVTSARKQLATVLDNGGDIYERVREKAVEQAKYADTTVRENPYSSIGVALLVGVLIATIVSLLTRRDDE